MLLRKIKINSSAFVIYFTLALLFSFNLILKISFLDSEPFWYDEIVSIKSSVIPFGHIKHISEWDNNPPFYYYCLSIWLNIVGVSEFNARLLSVIFSSLSAICLFSFSKNIFNFKTGLCSAIVFSFHDFIYEYSHETRSYSLTVFLTLISSILIFKLLEKPSLKWAILLGLINFLLIYTHYLTGLVLFFQLIFIIFASKKTFRLFSFSLLISLLFVVFRFTKKQYSTIFSFNKTEQSFWLQKSDFSAFHDSILCLFGGKNIYLIFVFVFIISTFLFLFIKRKNELQTKALIYCLLIGSGSIIVLFFIGMLTPVFLARYLIFSVPFLIIIAVLLFTENTKWMIAGLPLVIYAQTTQLNLNPKKSMDFRTAANVTKLLNKNSEKTLILLQTTDISDLFIYYFNKDWFMDYNHMRDHMKKNNIYDLNSVESLKNIDYKDYSRIIFCQSFQDKEKSESIFKEINSNKFKISTIKAIKGVDISLIKKI